MTSHPAELTLPIGRGNTVPMRSLVSALFVLAIAVVSLGPVLYVLVASFDNSQGLHDWEFGLDSWRSLLSDRSVRSSVLMTFLLSLRVPVGVLVAVIAVWLLVRVDVPGRRFIELSLWFGFFMPSIPIVTGWILLLDGNSGLFNKWLMDVGLVDHPVFAIHSVAGITFAHLTMHTLPIMVILLVPAFRQFDATLEEAAIVAGAGRRMTLRRVVFPIIAPAALVAGTASYIQALESFEIEQILGTPVGVNVYSTTIYDVIADDPPQFALAMALSSVFLVILIGLLAFYRSAYRSGAERPSFTGRAGFYSLRHSPWLRWGGGLTLILFVLMSVYLPFAALLMGSFMRLFGFFNLPETWTTDHWASVLTNPLFLRAGANTVVLGLTAGFVGTVLFAAIGWILVRSGLRWRGLAGFLVWLPWAIPGIVFGLVFLDLLLTAPGISLLKGTMVPVVYLLIVKDMPIGVQMMRVAVAQVPRSMEEAALVSGARRLLVFLRVTLPLISPACVAVFLYVFASAVRDISTLVLVAPPNLQTLSLLMFSYADATEFESASVVGTIVAAMSLVLAIAASRFSESTGAYRTTR